MTDERAILTRNQGEIDPFDRVANRSGGPSHITGDLLRFTKRGEFRAGQEKDLIPEGTRMMVYMPGLKEGYVRWQDGRPTQHLVGLVSEFEAPDRNTLGDLDPSTWPLLGGKPNDPWQFTYYLIMCDQQGQIYTYVTSSETGCGAVSGLAKMYAPRRRMKPDEIPVISLHSRPWKHVEFGDMVAPELKVVGWSKIPDTFAEIASNLAVSEQPLLGSALEPDEQLEVETVQEQFELEPAPAPTPRAKVAAKPAATQKPKRNAGRSLRL